MRSVSGLSSTPYVVAYGKLGRRSLLIFTLFLGSSLWAGEVKTLSLSPAPGMTRAELDYVETTAHPRAVLVICPGDNGKGGNIIRSETWQEFARQHQLGLVGLSYASAPGVIHGNDGYYHVAKGSGEILERGIREIFGSNPPLLLYGFSGGAHFVSHFEEWKPEAVLAWSVYSAGWWIQPVKKTVNPPGLVACGSADRFLGPTLIYFKQGRALGNPWLWVCVPKTGHAASPQLDEFVRQYFAAILSGPASAAGEWVDIDTRKRLSAAEAQAAPSLSGLLPSGTLFKLWNDVHEP
jgi:hypothetical protein